MTLLLECCEKCFMHKEQMHEESEFYTNYAKLSEKVANRCNAEIAKNPRRTGKGTSSLFFQYPKTLRQFYLQEKNNHFPRIGSFELYFKDICLFSKLSEGVFPDFNFICNVTLTLQRTENVEHIDMMMKKHECDSLFQLFKTTLLKPTLGVKEKEITFQYKQMYQALNPQKKAILNPNLPPANMRRNKSAQKLKNDLKIKSQTTFKYKDNTKITIQEDITETPYGKSNSKNEISGSEIIFRNSITENNTKDTITKKENQSSISRIDRKSSTMIESRDSISKPKKQLTVIPNRRLRCKHFSNQYTTMTKRSELVSKLASKEFKEIKEENFEYLTKNVDQSESDSESSLSEFSLENLSESDSNDSQSIIVEEPLKKVEPEVSKKRKKSYETYKSSVKKVPKVWEQSIPTVKSSVLSVKHDLKGFQKRFSSTLNGDNENKILKAFEKTKKSEFIRSSERFKGFNIEQLNECSSDNKISETCAEKQQSKETIAQSNTDLFEQKPKSKKSRFIKAKHKESILQISKNQKENKPRDEKKFVSKQKSKSKILNPSKLLRNSQIVTHRVQSKNVNSPKKQPSKQKSNSLFCELPSKNQSACRNESKEKFEVVLQEKKYDEQKSNRTSHLSSDRQMTAANQENQNVEQLKKSYQRSTKEIGLNVDGKQKQLLTEQKSQEPKQQKSHSKHQKTQENTLQIEKNFEKQPSQKTDDIKVQSNQQSMPKPKQVCLVSNFLISNFQKLINLSDSKAHQSEKSLILAQAIKKFYPSPFLAFDVKQKKKLQRFFKSVKEKNDDQQTGNGQSKSNKFLFGENDLCKVIAYSQGKSPVLFKRVVDLTGEIQDMQFFMTAQNEEQQKFMAYSKIKKAFSQLYFWFARQDYHLFGATFKFQSQCQPQQRGAIKTTKPSLVEHYDICKPESSQFEFQFRVSGEIGQEHHLFASYSSASKKEQTSKQESQRSVQGDDEVKVLIWKANEEGDTEDLVGEIQKKNNFFFELFLEPGNFVCKLIKCRGEFSEASQVDFNFYSNANSISFHSIYE